MWRNILKNSSYVTFEDPVTGFNTPKTEYINIYGRAFDDIFNGGFTISMFFAENPLLRGQWLFVDNDARWDLYDIAVDLGLINTLIEIQEGETRKEKLKRKKDTRVENVENTYQLRLNEAMKQLVNGELSKKQYKKLNREIRWLKHKIG